MARKVLHLLSQRPSFTGSGVSLDATVRLAKRAGWSQRVVVGVPREDPHPDVGGLDGAQVLPLVFGKGSLDFPLPGMSDVMPYPSSRFSALDAGQLSAYREAWRRHVAAVVAAFQPDVIHSRHVWLLSSIVKDVAPEVPVATHCHATGLRQMALCPELGEEVARGCARNDRFCVLHRGHAETLNRKLGVSPDRIRVVGSGYQSAVFHAQGREDGVGMNVLYAGKYSHAKGLPQLLDAVERLHGRKPRLVLHVAGDGAGAEAEALRARMAAMGPQVVMHGQIGQEALADLMRRCAVFVLPSFYEGLPLVLVEAVACGCRLVCTDLPSIREGLGAGFDEVLERVKVPRLIGPDVPAPEALPTFVDDLAAGITAALDKPPIGDPIRTMPDVLDRFTWEAVFGRIESLWLDLTSSPCV
jgi:glycosyltransferase involved in cell wall biosynthesis